MKQPTLFFRRFTQTWYVQIHGRQINLGPDNDLAWEAYHRLMTSRGKLSAQLATLAELFETYLDCRLNPRAEETCRLALHLSVLCALRPC